jgi:hypothetical protein
MDMAWTGARDLAEHYDTCIAHATVIQGMGEAKKGIQSNTG